MSEELLTVELRNFIAEQKLRASDLSKQAVEIRKKIREAEDAAHAAADLLPIVGHPDIVREQLDHIRERLSERGLDLQLTELWDSFNRHTYTSSAVVSPVEPVFKGTHVKINAR